MHQYKVVTFKRWS